MTTQRFVDRTFQLWEYRVSHGSLLIRSPQGADAKKNVDIVCTGVEYLAAPRFMRGVEVTEPTIEELRHLEQLLGKQLTASSVVILASAGQRFQIVSASFKVEENEKDIFESSFEWFRAEKGATQIAQEGGRHAGQLQQFLKQTPDQLQRTIRSFDKQIAKHEGWIADPASKVPNFSQLRPEHQQNLIHHWKQDIARHQELRSTAQDVLKGLPWWLQIAGMRTSFTFVTWAIWFGN
jgi:hypothetical protein